MSYPKNAATPPRIAVGAVVQISDGAVQTSGVSIRVVPQGGSAAAGLGTTTYEDGIVLYAPTQAETNYEAFCVIAYKTGCIPAATTVVTSDTATAGRVRLSGETHSGATIPTVTTITNAVTAGTVSDKTGYTLSASGLASITAWTVAITGNITGNVSGSVGSVTGAVGSVTGNVGGNVTGSVGSVASGVTVTTNNDKTGYSLTQSFPSNFASLAITAGGAVTAGTVSDKTGYSLTQSFPTNFSSLAITAGGSVTAGTVSDKTGYSLTQAFPTNFSSMAISASGVVDANTVLWGGSTLPTVGTSTLTASQVWSHAARTLTAFAFTPNVNVTQWDGGSLPTIGTSTLTASDVWTHATRTLTAFGFNVTVGTNNDKTGYVLTQAFPINFSSLAITAGGSVTAGTVSDKTGYSLTQAFPTNFSSLGINASGHISRVTLVDTTTTNTDMRGTDGAALASVWTSTVAGRIDMPLSDIPTASENADAVWDEAMAGHTTAGTYGGRIPRSDTNNVEVKITGAKHLAADVHDLQPAVIESQHFALGAVDANALAADASSEIATAVRTNLAVELARINVAIDTRLAATDYMAPPTATTVADAVLTRNVSNVENVAGTTTLCTLVLAGVGKALTVGGVLNIYRTNGTTVHATKTLTTDPNADPVTGIS